MKPVQCIGPIFLKRNDVVLMTSHHSDHHSDANDIIIVNFDQISHFSIVNYEQDCAAGKMHKRILNFVLRILTDHFYNCFLTQCMPVFA